MKRIYWIGLILLFCKPVIGQSIQQYVISTSGNHFEENNINMSWTIGECFVETYDENQLILNQGFHQDTIQIVITNIFETEMNQNVLLYPNPANSTISFSFPYTENNTHTLKIYDVKGILKKEQQINRTDYTINIKDLDRGMYIIQILENSVKKRNYQLKFIKN